MHGLWGKPNRSAGTRLMEFNRQDKTWVPCPSAASCALTMHVSLGSETEVAMCWWSLGMCPQKLRGLREEGGDCFISCVLGGFLAEVELVCGDR